MAALPLAQQGLDTTVPRDVQSGADTPRADQIVMRYDADGRISINEHPVTLADLPERLRSIFEARIDKTLYLLGDGSLRYGAIVTVMDAAKGSGVSRLGVITQGMRQAAGRPAP